MSQISVYCTFPDENSAAEVVRTLLSERLIACGNVLPGARSLYVWEGQIEDTAEAVCFLKTSDSLSDRVTRRITELHPYETPAVVVLPVTGGSRKYLDWVRSCVDDPTS